MQWVFVSLAKRGPIRLRQLLGRWLNRLIRVAAPPFYKPLNSLVKLVSIMNSSADLANTLTAASASTWLEHISKLETIPAGHTLYSALKKLNRSPPNNQDLLSLLEQITPTVLHYADDLNTLFLSSLNGLGYIHKRSRKPGRLSAQLIRTLSLAWSQTAADQTLNRSDKIQATFTALQLIGFSLKTQTLISERPSSTLRIKMGKLFRLATDEGFIDEPVSPKIPVFRNQKTIASVLKRNLLYALFNLYSAPPERLQHYYGIADRYADKLAFAKSPKTFFNFYWNSAEPYLPQRGLPHHGDDHQLIFNILEVVQCISETLPPSEREDPVFDGIWRNLSGYQQVVDSVSPCQPELYSLETGLKAAFDQLKHCNRLTNIRRLSAELPKTKILRALELAPLEHEKQGYQSRWEAAAKLQADNIKSRLVSLLPTKDPLFFLVQIKGNRLVHDLPVLLHSPQNPPKFGIIRRLQTQTETQNQTALIETLPSRAFPINITMRSLSVEAILIQTSEGCESLVIAPDKYSTGDCISRSDVPDKVFYLSRLVESSRHFMRFQLIAD